MINPSVVLFLLSFGFEFGAGPSGDHVDDSLKGRSANSSGLGGEGGS
jgi:hypothetical protein